MLIQTNLQYYYSIVSFMPDRVRGEFLNVGIVLHLPNSGTLLTRWLDRVERIQLLHSSFSDEGYKNFQNKLATFPDNDFFRGKRPHLADPASPELLSAWHREMQGHFQFRAPVGGLTDDPKFEVDDLYNIFVKPPNHTEMANENIITNELARKHLAGEYPELSVPAVVDLEASKVIDNKYPKKINQLAILITPLLSLLNEKIEDEIANLTSEQFAANQHNTSRELAEAIIKLQHNNNEALNQIIEAINSINNSEIIEVEGVVSKREVVVKH